MRKFLPNVPVQHARIRPKSALEAYQEGALADSPLAPGIGTAIANAPEVMAPAAQISRRFEFQSYFDSTLLQNAILSQSPNSPIVDSTVQEVQMSGYAVGLHPSSQTPVAVEFKVGGQSSSSPTVTLKPGQIIRPHGIGRGGTPGHFSGFRWGLPFGWLGGGVATLAVFQTPDSDVAWTGDHELIFHRQRMLIYAPASLAGLVAASKNWPTRFPWTQAVQGANLVVQKGQANIALEPTKTLMTLRMATLAAPATMRIALHETNDFNLDSTGAVIATETVAYDYTWGTWAGSGGGGNLAVQYKTDFMPNPMVRLSADDGGMVLIDMTGTLAGQYVDVVRYGRLG